MTAYKLSRWQLRGELIFDRSEVNYKPNSQDMDVTYDKIGTGYNATRRADPYLTDRIFSLLDATPGKLYLDIGCGTGNYTSALAEKGLNFMGVEPSEKMLFEARKTNPNIRWLAGTAEKIPAAGKTFDGIIATLTIHHWADISKSFAELSRVLADTGKIVMFTSTPKQMKGYWLNHYFPEMLKASMVQMPSLDKIKAAADKANLKISTTEKYVIKDDLQDCFLYVGKNKPEYYFNDTIRHGISSFSSLSHIDEVRRGLTKLRTDIDNNSFEEIKKHYENDSGDYLFISIVKKGD